MITGEELRIEEAAREIAKFQAGRQLAATAVVLEAQSKSVKESIRALGIQRSELEDGIGIVVKPVEEDGHLRAEYRGWRDWGEGAGKLFQRCDPSTEIYNENVQYAAGRFEAFTGSSIDFEASTGEVWVYDQSMSFRVLVDDSVMVHPVHLDATGL